MEAIRYTKSIPRYLAMRYLGKRWRSLYTSPFSCTRLVDIPEPQLPTPEWGQSQNPTQRYLWLRFGDNHCEGESLFLAVYVNAVCIRDMKLWVKLRRWVGQWMDFPVGARVVLEPALSCPVRGISPPCHQCRNQRFANCENITKGDISEGVQTGYCRDTGGGWSQYVLAHQSQLHLVPDDISDEAAVLLEPFACALHGVLKIPSDRTATICVIGGGTIGLLTVAALRVLGHRNRIIIFAKYPHQQELARELGADDVLSPNSDRYAVFCELTGATSHQPELGQQVLVGGVDVTFDCIGSSVTIDDTLRFTRAGGDVILVGMPGIPKNVDWTSIWYKQLRVTGAYTYGLETHNGEQIHTFTLGMRLLQKMEAHLRPLVSTLFPLRDYKRAIQTALEHR